MLRSRRCLLSRHILNHFRSEVSFIVFYMICWGVMEGSTKEWNSVAIGLPRCRLLCEPPQCQHWKPKKGYMLWTHSCCVFFFYLLLRIWNLHHDPFFFEYGPLVVIPGAGLGVGGCELRRGKIDGKRRASTWELVCDDSCERDTLMVSH